MLKARLASFLKRVVLILDGSLWEYLGPTSWDAIDGASVGLRLLG